MSLASRAAIEAAELRAAARRAARPVYRRREEGPHLVVERKDLSAPRSKAAREATDINQIRTVVASPKTNPALRIANAASLGVRGVPLENTHPVSSLRRQSGIGRAFEAAAEGSPAYKHATFERYGEMMPQVVEGAKAQNLDQLTEAAYRALGEETTQQFDKLPLSFRYHQGDLEYPTPSAMMRDALGNGRLNVFRGGDPHDYLSRIDPVTGLSQNEMFRAVHDYLGHVTRGNTFRPEGEEIAYATHARTMSPLAQLALLSETRGQNSVVNYTGLNADLTGEMNAARRRLRERDIAQQLTLSPSFGERREGEHALTVLPRSQELRAQLRELGGQTRFADQKAVLLPPEYLDPMSEGGMPGWLHDVIDPRAPEQARGVHISKRPDLETLDPSFYGTGHHGAEYQSVLAGGRPNRSYLYSGPEGTVQPEPGVLGATLGGEMVRGPRYGYEASVDDLYDIDADPEKLVALSRAYNLPHYDPVISPDTLARRGEHGITGQSAIPDVERLLGEYGYRGLLADRPGTDQRWMETFNPIPNLRRIDPGPRGYAVGGRVI